MVEIESHLVPDVGMDAVGALVMGCGVCCQQSVDHVHLQRQSDACRCGHHRDRAWASVRCSSTDGGDVVGCVRRRWSGLYAFVVK